MCVGEVRENKVEEKKEQREEEDKKEEQEAETIKMGKVASI